MKLYSRINLEGFEKTMMYFRLLISIKSFELGTYLLVERIYTVCCGRTLVVRTCSVLLTLYRSYFWVWERHLSGVGASVLEEYAASMFMVNVTGSTSPLICHVGLNSVCLRLVVNAAETAGCLEGLFIMLLVNFLVRNGNT
jgi:hypothetical protein